MAEINETKRQVLIDLNADGSVAGALYIIKVSAQDGGKEMVSGERRERVSLKELSAHIEGSALGLIEERNALAKLLGDEREQATAVVTDLTARLNAATAKANTLATAVQAIFGEVQKQADMLAKGT